MAQPTIERLKRVAEGYPNFAGLWWEGDVIHVAFVDPTEETAPILQNAVERSARMVVETARWTLAELEQAEQIAQRLMTDPRLGVMMVFIRAPKNRVAVGIRQTTLDETRALLEYELGRASLAGSTLVGVSEGVTYDY